ncbi:MAG: hypothetical protein IPJ19_15160 [Planctomycetes bacterium]|nr:hypothetical protein [Planctomycetota bacterium]
MTEELFRAQRPWSAKRPSKLVVCCSDGRWHGQIQEFVAKEVDHRSDMFAVPGGPAVIDAMSSSYEESKIFDNGMHLFVQYHNLDSVWLISHHDCAFYRVRYPDLDDTQRLTRQREDLLRAARLVKARYPEFEVKCMHATFHEGMVAFEPVE